MSTSRSTDYDRPIRTGRVLYLAGYCQDTRRPGRHPVYQTARVEEYPGPLYLYWPRQALAHTTDGGVELPAHLISQVIWEAP